MKTRRLFLFFTILFLFTLTRHSIAQEPDTYVFDRVSHDFGILKPGKTETTVFKLTNTGTTPLIIIDAGVSCRCAKIKWPKKPIPPGESAELTVEYKDKQSGTFYKVINIFTNNPPQKTQLRITGTIE